MVLSKSLRLIRRLAYPREDEVSSPVVRVLDTDSEIATALFWAGPPPVFMLRPQQLVLQGGRPYTPDHPFIQALTHGPAALEDFYRRFTPANLAQMYGIDPIGLKGEGLPPWELPWLYRTRSPPRGEAGLGPEHGTSFYGPCSAQKIALEYTRLRGLAESIARLGYRPGSYEHIEGHFLRRGGEFRFFVRGGKHRAAVLAFLGHDFIPVRVRASWPRVIEAGRTNEWPLVALGEVDARFADSIHERYFSNEQ